ncbi:MAG TPA: MFS transporter [Thermomicrobiales bacterium]|nr:MFS transporter [Thermomicrobiales bacterium]
MARSPAVGGTFSALQTNPLFRRLWFASTGYSLSQWMQNIALGWLAFELTDSERFVGLVAFSAGIPFVAVSIPGGALLDRFDRRSVLLISQALAAVVATCVAIDVLSGNAEAWHLLLAGFLNGSLQAIITPSQQSIVPRLVEPRDLQNALGLMSAGGNMTRVFGPALAGTLIAALGTGYPFLLQALAVSAAFMVIFSSDFPRMPPSTGRLGLDVISDGARIITSRPDLRELFMLSALPSLLIFPYLSFLNVYAEEVMKIGSEGLGVLLAASGIGAVIGGLMVAATKTSDGMGIRLYRLTFLYCLMLVAFSIYPSWWVAIPSLCLAGLVGSYAFSGNNALVQQRISDEVRGRVMGTYLLTWGLMPLGALWMGEVGQLWSIQVATFAGAAVCAAAVLLLRFKSQELHAI